MSESSPRKSWATGAMLATAILLAAVIIAIGWNRRPDRPFEITRAGSSYPASTLPMSQGEIGATTVARPRILHVAIANLWGDKRPEVIVCDASRQQVLVYEQPVLGEWKEHSIADGAAPCHATVVDLDDDGDQDVLVALLGNPWPTDDRVGGVLWLENTGDQEFTRHTILQDVRRVTDVQAGDLDADGDIDLAVAEFGFQRGQILWLENRGDQTFLDHQLLATPGAIHVPIADFDSDGDLDILSVVTQEDEEIWAFENTSETSFSLRPKLIHYDVNFDLGGAGLIADDLDQDGDMDLLLSAGDNLDLIAHYPQPYHGCYWFENVGGWQFRRQRIGDLGGTYATAVGDLDADGDRDVVLVSMFNNWWSEGVANAVWLENDGSQKFTSWQLSDSPIHLVTVACGDLNEDGRDDIVAGGMHLQSPFDRLGRVTTWVSQAPENAR